MLNVEKCIYHCNSGEKSKLIENIRGETVRKLIS